MSDPEEARKVIEVAAENHDVDLADAITAIDPTEGSSRIFILDQRPDGDYRLISMGLDADGNAQAPEQPLHIPEGAISMVQSLLHGAGMQQAHNMTADADASLRDVSEGMGITEPYLADSEEYGAD